ncbi:AbrB family transcriptional regulator, partial [Pseudomonas sp. 2822-15]|uniref:AbrB family transcriptional regulator n=1 Tax=Pseudomonas sp. 2822-15 TaxID=1712677 RepID=UPI00117B718F
FQTVRLLTVLFLVPFIIVQFFSGETIIIEAPPNEHDSTLIFSYAIYIIPLILGIWLRNLIPAGIVIIPMATTVILNISSIEIASLPTILLVIAQVTVGIGIGKNISIRELQQGGKYCLIYFSLAII